MKTLTRIAVIAAVIAFLVPFTSQNVRAQGKHPAYLHALSDLRDARAHLHVRTAALCTVKRARPLKRLTTPSMKSSAPHSTTARTLKITLPWTLTIRWAGRLHKARELLDKAHHDIEKEEDNPEARGLRDRVIMHIDRAHHHVDEAIAIVDTH